MPPPTVLTPGVAYDRVFSKHVRMIWAFVGRPNVLRFWTVTLFWIMTLLGAIHGNMTQLVGRPIFPFATDIRPVLFPGIRSELVSLEV